MKFTFISRDHKRCYKFNPDSFKEMRLYSDESIDTYGSDEYFLCLLEGETKLTPQELFDIWRKFDAGEANDNNIVGYRREVNGLMVTSCFQLDDNGIVHGQDFPLR